MSDIIDFKYHKEGELTKEEKADRDLALLKLECSRKLGVPSNEAGLSKAGVREWRSAMAA